MKITLFDTAVCTENLGDFIIMDAVREHINEIFSEAMVLHTATHENISRPTYHMVKNSDLSFVGGTNLISSNMNYYNQWKINLIDSLFLKDIILMGVGWWQYQNDANFYTRNLLKSVLHHDILHSVRDSYAEAMLKKAGFNNVINTSCATMWRLDEVHCAQIPIAKAENVVATLTDYNKDSKNDLALIKLLNKSYQKVYIWPQGSGDLAYIEQLGLSNLAEILPPKLEDYNQLLDSDTSLDSVGTRLHAGVRALQKKRRAIILGIDNRAFEKAKDFNIKVCARDQLDELKTLIQSDFSTEIKLPSENIARWKSQFK
jgi:polysaccharide pyruvyl transferase WcaK-like protein